MNRYEYKVSDTGKHVEEQLNELGAQGWWVVGVTTKKQPCPENPDPKTALDVDAVPTIERERPLEKGDRGGRFLVG